MKARKNFVNPAPSCGGSSGVVGSGCEATFNHTPAARAHLRFCSAPTGLRIPGQGWREAATLGEPQGKFFTTPTGLDSSRPVLRGLSPTAIHIESLRAFRHAPSHKPSPAAPRRFWKHDPAPNRLPPPCVPSGGEHD